MFKKIIIVSLCLLFVLSLCACGEKKANALVGTWKYNEHVQYEFDNEGHGCLCQDDAHYVYTYKISGDKVNIDFEANVIKDCFYTFTVVENDLTIIGGEGTDGGTYKLVKIK